MKNNKKIDEFLLSKLHNKDIKTSKFLIPFSMMTVLLVFLSLPDVPLSIEDYLPTFFILIILLLAGTTLIEYPADS